MTAADDGNERALRQPAPALSRQCAQVPAERDAADISAPALAMWWSRRQARVLAGPACSQDDTTSQASVGRWSVPEPGRPRQGVTPNQSSTTSDPPVQRIIRAKQPVTLQRFTSNECDGRGDQAFRLSHCERSRSHEPTSATTAKQKSSKRYTRPLAPDWGGPVARTRASSGVVFATTQAPPKTLPILRALDSPGVAQVQPA